MQANTAIAAVHANLTGTHEFKTAVTINNSKLDKLVGMHAITLVDTLVNESVSSLLKSVNWTNKEKNTQDCKTVRGQTEVTLKNIVVKEYVFCQNGSIEAESCDLPKMSCDTRAKLIKVNAVGIAVMKGPLTATDCNFSGEVRAKGSMTLTNSKIQSLKLFFGDDGKAVLNLDKTEIEGDLIVEQIEVPLSAPVSVNRISLGRQGEVLRFDGPSALYMANHLGKDYPEGSIGIFNGMKYIIHNKEFRKFEVILNGQGTIKGNLIIMYCDGAAVKDFNRLVQGQIRYQGKDP